MARTHNFRFYGEHPSDWDEGAVDGHLFSIQLERAPSESELAQIAEIYEQSLYRGPASPASEPWSWSDRFASFLVGERWDQGGAAFVGAVKDFLTLLCSIVPVVDAVFYGAYDDARAPKAKPDAGPDHGRAACPAFQRPVDTELPPSAPNAMFEERRQEARAALDEAKIVEVIGKRKRGQVGLAPSSEKLGPAPEAPRWGAKVLAALEIADGDRLSECRGRPLVFVAADAHRFDGLAYLDDAAKRKQVQFPASDHVISIQPQAVLNAANDRCLLIAEQKVYEADLSSGKARLIYAAAVQGTEPANAAIYLPDGRAVVGTTKSVYLMDAAGAVPRVLDSVAGSAGGLNLVHEGRVLITGPKPRVIACADGKLTRIGSFNTEMIWFAREQQGKVLFEGPSEKVYELTHLEEVYGRLAKKKKATRKTAAKEASKKTAAKKRTIDLERVKPSSLPPAVKKAPRETRSRFKRALEVVTCPAGRVAAMLKGNLFGWGVQYIDTNDEVVDLTPLVQEEGKLQALSGIALSDCGSRLYIRPSSHNIYAVNLEADPPALEAVIKDQVTAHGPLMDFRPFGRDELFALGYTQLVWLRRSASAWEQVAAVSVKKGTQLAVTTADNRPAAAAVLTDTKQRLQVFDLAGDEITPVGKLADPVEKMEARGAHLLVRLSNSQLEVTGIPGSS